MNREAQTRTYPEVRIWEKGWPARISGVLAVLMGLGLVLGIAVPATLYGGCIVGLLFAFLGFIIIYAGLLYAGLDLLEWLLVLGHRRSWRRLQVTADGRILERAVKKREDSYGNVSQKYWTTFQFDTAEGPVTLKARVEKRHYDRLRRGRSVTVRYAVENPRLALLEGEWDE